MARHGMALARHGMLYPVTRRRALTRGTYHAWDAIPRTDFTTEQTAQRYAVQRNREKFRASD